MPETFVPVVNGQHAKYNNRVPGRLSDHYPNLAEPDYLGKTRAKPAIWAERDKFTGAQQSALAKAQALDAAVKTGYKMTIQVAFYDMGKNGCGGCHTLFHEPTQE